MDLVTLSSIPTRCTCTFERVSNRLLFVLLKKLCVCDQQQQATISYYFLFLSKPKFYSLVNTPEP